MLTSKIVRGWGSIEDLKPAWRDLWHNAVRPSGFCQIPLLRLYQQTFEPNARPLFVIINDNSGQLVAVLPLMEVDSTYSRFGMKRLKGFSNHWFQSGHWLVRSGTSESLLAAAAAEELASLHYNQVHLDWVPIEQSPWSALLSNLTDRGCGVLKKSNFQVGTSALPPTWEAYEAQLSKNSRKKSRAQWKQIQQQGAVRCQVYRGYDDWRSAFQAALDIEMDSWKGGAGTAIGSDQKIAGFFHQAASLLAELDLLRLFILTLDDRPIAFDWGCVGGGTYRSVKISYRQSLADLSPGNVMSQLVTRHFIESPSGVDTIDTVGPLTEANQRWTNQTYQIGQVSIAPGRWLLNYKGHGFVSLMNLRSRISQTTAVAGIKSILK